jgi:PIN domain nuclease of toxin-antitoxin system
MAVLGAMTWLLDPHSSLWAVSSPNRRSARARALLLNGVSRLLGSSPSAWEISPKHRLGRLLEAQALFASFSDQVRNLRAGALGISVEHALAAGRFPSPHRDPCDRIRTWKGCTWSPGARHL